MFRRFSLPALLLTIGIAVSISGCSNPLAVSLAISPATQSLSVGQTSQLSAQGTYGHGANHPPSTQDVTSQVSWSTNAQNVATVSSSGVVTAVGAGTATVTATMNGFTGIVSATATVTVTGGGSGTGTVAGITSITVIPGSQSVANPGQTTQFLAIGTTAASSTVDLTSQVAWKSSAVSIATIGNNTGLATGLGQGTSTITALYNNPSGGNTVTGTATFTVVSGTTEQFTAVTIVPNSQSLSASGQTGQFIALAKSGATGLEVDVTNSPQISWSSSQPSIATVSSAGLAQGVSVGSTTITALLKNPDNSLVSNSASITTTNTVAPEPLLSLQIIPSSITVGNLQGTGQFLAIGTFSSAPNVRDLTNSVTWISSSPNIFPINSNGTGIPNPGIPAGVVTAYGSGSDTVIAEENDPTITNGSIQTAAASFNCPLILPTPTQAGSCYLSSVAVNLLSSLTIYNMGLNTTGWLVTAPSASGTPNVLHCGPGSSSAGLGASVCVTTYPVGSPGLGNIILTAPSEPGVRFGGWSYNCTPSDVNGNPLPPPTSTAPTFSETGPNYCVVNLISNTTVGAIFN